MKAERRVAEVHFVVVVMNTGGQDRGRVAMTVLVGSVVEGHDEDMD